MANEIADDELFEIAENACANARVAERPAVEARALYEAGMRAVIEHIENNHGLDECVCTGCLREDLLGEACDA